MAEARHEAMAAMKSVREQGEVCGLCYAVLWYCRHAHMMRGVGALCTVDMCWQRLYHLPDWRGCRPIPAAGREPKAARPAVRVALSNWFTLLSFSLTHTHLRQQPSECH